MFGAVIFSFLYRAEFFTQTKRMGYFFVWRNVSVLEGELGAARYCAKGTICNDRGGQGSAVSLPAGPGQRPDAGPGGGASGSSEDTSFYSTKSGSKIDAFFAGIL